MADACTPPAKHEQVAQQIFNTVFDHSLSFRIELPYETARDFLRQVGTYNAFSAEAVLAALDSIDALIPRMRFGEGNPNNGNRDYRISVGREGSPVIYLERYERDEGEKAGDVRSRLICREMRTTASADEADYWVEGDKVTFRFWWD